MANVVDMDVRASIERQAINWLVRMDGDAPLTDAEKADLNEWMSRSPAHRDEIVGLARRWKRANILTELAGGVDSRHERRKLCWASLIRGMLIPSCAVVVSFALLYGICGK